MIERFRPFALPCLVLSLLLVADSAAAQPPCPLPVFNRELEQPRVIPPINGLLNTSLTVDQKTANCVPLWVSQDAAGKAIPNPHWEYKVMSLRTYGSPRDGNNPQDPTLIWNSPGPTYRVRKAKLKDPNAVYNPQANPVVVAGTRFRLLLKNELPNNNYPYHDCQPSEVQQPPPPGSTSGIKIPEKGPDCFHGADVTNIHYHGTHVSPQPHHDFPLVELFSSKQTNPAPPPPGELVAIGTYQTELDPFPWNQPPGTHWYHPHKHGATALQVLNGLSGSLLIEGELDDWLWAYYKVDGRNPAAVETFEKLMDIQQQWPELNYFHRPHPNYPPQPLINGQADPKITFRYGEVKRLRFINATMQASAELTVDFPDDFIVKQIAQDGVQFAPQNYSSQPLLGPGQTFSIAPGNRADFLVQAPASSKEAAPGMRAVTFAVFGNVATELRNQLDLRLAQRLKGLAAGATSPSLFTIDLTDKNPISPAMKLPTTWPAMPPYLNDITSTVRDRTMAFSMTDPNTGIATTPGTQPNGFWIDKLKYNASCANETMTIGTGERWTITNDSAPNHPFHIHTNPFQVVRNDTTTYKPPYVWQDTIALPNVSCKDAAAGPISGQPQADATCPGVCKALDPQGGIAYTWNGQWRTTVPGTQSVCGCCQGPPVKSVEILQRFEDYTGGYVLHCHFLGHEDRGMMQNVQTVCPPGGTDPKGWKYGKTRTDGMADDCGATSPTAPFAPCPPFTPGMSSGGMSHHH